MAQTDWGNVNAALVNNSKEKLLDVFSHLLFALRVSLHSLQTLDSDGAQMFVEASKDLEVVLNVLVIFVEDAFWGEENPESSEEKFHSISRAKLTLTNLMVFLRSQVKLRGSQRDEFDAYVDNVVDKYLQEESVHRPHSRAAHGKSAIKKEILKMLDLSLISSEKFGKKLVETIAKALTPYFEQLPPPTLAKEIVRNCSPQEISESIRKKDKENSGSSDIFSLSTSNVQKQAVIPQMPNKPQTSIFQNKNVSLVEGHRPEFEKDGGDESGAEEKIVSNGRVSSSVIEEEGENAAHRGGRFSDVMEVRDEIPLASSSSVASSSTPAGGIRKDVSDATTSNSPTENVRGRHVLKKKNGSSRSLVRQSRPIILLENLESLSQNGATVGSSSPAKSGTSKLATSRESDEEINLSHSTQSDVHDVMTPSKGKRRVVDSDSDNESVGRPNHGCSVKRKVLTRTLSESDSKIHEKSVTKSALEKMSSESEEEGSREDERTSKNRYRNNEEKNGRIYRKKEKMMKKSFAKSGDDMGGQKLVEGTRNFKRVKAGGGHESDSSSSSSAGDERGSCDRDHMHGDELENRSSLHGATRRFWSSSEQRALEEGVERFGAGNWGRIRAEYYDSLKHRTNVDIKDKWRILQHPTTAAPAVRGTDGEREERRFGRRLKWTNLEMRCLFVGCLDYQVGHWAEIKRKYARVFKNRRTPVNLKDKYRTMKTDGTIKEYLKTEKEIRKFVLDELRNRDSEAEDAN